MKGGFTPGNNSFFISSTHRFVIQFPNRNVNILLRINSSGLFLRIKNIEKMISVFVIKYMVQAKSLA